MLKFGGQIVFYLNTKPVEDEAAPKARICNSMKPNIKKPLGFKTGHGRLRRRKKSGSE